MSSLRIRSAAAAVVAALALAGCASGYRLDTVVETHSFLQSLPPDPTYRLERLPSQQQEVDQPQVEAVADPALFAAGLRRDDANPRYAVRVGARLERGWARGIGPWGWSWVHPPVQTAANTYYHREVQVLIRDLRSQRVVYDSTAVSDTFYLDNAEVMAAMFRAVLAGFPGGVQGTRVVSVDVVAANAKGVGR
jgi:hypothetical protein